MIKKLIDNFLSKEQNVSDYREGVRLLRRSGFLDLVRRLGFPNVIDNGSNIASMAHEGSWSNGFQTGVNNIEFFEELYANKVDPAASRVSPTFGAKNIAAKEGYLTEEELKKFN